MPGTTRTGGSVRARDLAVGMLMACTSLVANAVVNGDGSLAPRTAAALPEPFTIQDAALAASARPLTGSGLVVPGTAAGQPDDGSLGHRAAGAVASSGAVSEEPVENVVAVPPDTPPPFEPVRAVPGDELEGPMAPVLQPVTEVLASAVQSVAPPEVTEPAMSMLSPPLFA